MSNDYNETWTARKKKSSVMWIINWTRWTFGIKWEYYKELDITIQIPVVALNIEIK